jgi:hypothetical protein
MAAGSFGRTMTLQTRFSTHFMTYHNYLVSFDQSVIDEMTNKDKTLFHACHAVARAERCLSHVDHTAAEL